MMRLPYPEGSLQKEGISKHLRSPEDQKNYIRSLDEVAESGGFEPPIELLTL